MMDNPHDELRRRWLIRALRIGVYGAALAPGLAPNLASAQSSSQPGELPPGRSIHRLEGDVRVNGRRARRDTTIRPGDEVRTGAGASVTFVVDTDAFHLRERSRLQLEGAGAAASVLRLVTGALLSVFGRRETQVATPLATLGIRGTGVYVESAPDLSYICTCYGETELGTPDDPSVREWILSNQHDAPRYILPPGTAERIRVAPFLNHTDDELTLLEALVGREPPFAVFGDGYDGPTRTY